MTIAPVSPDRQVRAAYGDLLAVPDVASLERWLRNGARLAALALAASLEDDPGVIDLPPATTDADPAAIRGAAPLYLAGELESARVLPAIETLSGLFVTGAINADVGAAGEKLVAFWQHRRDRLTESEREALFGRAFGKQYGPDLALPLSGRNLEFEPLMLELAEALSQLLDDRAFGGVLPVREIAARTAAQSLASNVSHHTRGLAGFASSELLSAIADALAIVKDPAVQHSFGAHNAWGAIRALSRRYLGGEGDVESHVIRGRAGMAMLSWLADVLPRLDGETAMRLAGPNDPIIPAAIQWMQATLQLQAHAPVGSGS